MIAVAVTGGTGSGKSTAVRLLEAHGAMVVDADALSRAALGVGTHATAAVRERFGPGVFREDDVIDRAALAGVVFADEGARRDLEAIVHPVVNAGIAAALQSAEGSDVVVVVDHPLLVEMGGRERYALDGVLVVDTPEDLAVERVVRDRGLTAEQARARLAAQIDPAARLRTADFIIMNHGTREDLELMVELAWAWIEKLRETLGR